MGDPRRSRWWTLLCAAAAMGMMSALGGTWEAPLGAPPMVTPRGTAPLPPGYTPAPSTSQGTPQPPTAPPAATPTAPGAPVGIAPAAPTAAATPAPEPTATAVPAPPEPTATVLAPVSAVATPAPQRTTPAAPGTATPAPTATATATAPSGLIADDRSPAFPVVQPQSVAMVVRPDAPAPVTLTSADQRVRVTVAGAAVREPVRVTLAAASYAQGQREAGLRQGLLLTNVGFTLAAAPVAGGAGDPPDGEIAVRYSAAQVSGIEEASLGLYQRRAADGSWEALLACKAEAAERRIVCRAPLMGDFLLAGTKALAFDATVQTGAGAPGDRSVAGDASAPMPAVLAGLALVALLLAGGAAFILRGGRVRP